MNSTSHDAQSRHASEELRADWPIGADPASELLDAIDPTEDLANEVTIELPNPETSTSTARPRPADTFPSAVNGEADHHALTVTNGTVLKDRYVVEQQLVNGGTAVISRARDLQHDAASGDEPYIAIKMLRPEWRDRAQCNARLKREFRQTQSVAHPNVVRFYDLDCDRGTWFIAMELLNGETLGQRLRRASPRGLPAQETLRIAAECGDALAFAHERGVTHGDVKPDNVFITATDEVRVIDFGVAPESGPRPTAANDSVPDPISGAATRAYASPEVLTGQDPVPRDDVFSLACVIYEMLAGRHPYGRRGAKEARDADLEIEPPPGLSAPQWRALGAGLAWHREQRPGDVRELLRTLGAGVPDRHPTKAIVGLPVPLASGALLRSTGITWRSATAIVAAIALGVLLGRFGFESRGEPPTALRMTPSMVRMTPGSAATAAVAIRAAVAAAAGRRDTKPQDTAPVAIAPRAAPQVLPLVRVSFAAASMVVSRNAVAAAIQVRRREPAGQSTKIVWRAVDGTAVAGRDYGGPVTGEASFQEGQTLAIIYVPIVNRAQAAGDRTFAVELADASSGARLESTQRIIVVTIQDDG